MPLRPQGTGKENTCPCLTLAPGWLVGAGDPEMAGVHLDLPSVQRLKEEETPGQQAEKSSEGEGRPQKCLGPRGRESSGKGPLFGSGEVTLEFDS